MASVVPPQQWRAHPKLKGQLLAEDSDDLWVIAHDGGPCLTDRRPEAILVEVTGCDGEVFTGRVLYDPIQLRTVRFGQEIRFIVSKGGKQPVLVSEKYLAERALWTIEPCQKCGFDELFDAPSDLEAALSVHVAPTPSKRSFKTHCPLCGGLQVFGSKYSGTLARKRPARKKAGRTK